MKKLIKRLADAEAIGALCGYKIISLTDDKRQYITPIDMVPELTRRLNAKLPGIKIRDPKFLQRDVKRLHDACKKYGYTLVLCDIEYFYTLRKTITCETLTDYYTKRAIYNKYDHTSFALKYPELRDTICDRPRYLINLLIDFKNVINGKN